jgi:hypothetical protein
MAGYSGTPLGKKLGVKPGCRLVILGAPSGFAIPDLPADVNPRDRLAGAADVVVFFTKERARLAAELPRLQKAVHPDGAIWIAWPKKASGVPTDIVEDVVRTEALPRGLVDVKVCAIDEVWSGLRLVVRKELRTAAAAAPAPAPSRSRSPASSPAPSPSSSPAPASSPARKRAPASAAPKPAARRMAPPRGKRG